MNEFNNFISFCKQKEILYKIDNNYIVQFQFINYSHSEISPSHTFIFDFCNKDQITILCFSNFSLNNSLLQSLIFTNYINKLYLNSTIIVKDNFCIKQHIFPKFFEVRDNLWFQIIKEISNFLSNIEKFYFIDRNLYSKEILLNDYEFESLIVNFFDKYQKEKEKIENFTEKYYEDKIKSLSEQDLNNELDNLLLNYEDNLPKLNILRKYLLN